MCGSELWRSTEFYIWAATFFHGGWRHAALRLCRLVAIVCAQSYLDCPVPRCKSIAALPCFRRAVRRYDLFLPATAYEPLKGLPVRPLPMRRGLGRATLVLKSTAAHGYERTRSSRDLNLSRGGLWPATVGNAALL